MTADRKPKEFMTKGAERVWRWSFLIQVIAGVIVLVVVLVRALAG
ncbi:MAG TPA: hypothetical protein VIG64_01050 [Actinomycetota bacterium]|jgi:uncharacterized protein YpmS